MGCPPGNIFIGIADVHLLAFLGYHVHYSSLSFGDFPAGSLLKQALVENQDTKEQEADESNDDSGNKGVDNHSDHVGYFLMGEAINVPA
jgi:hypothetical protein